MKKFLIVLAIMLGVASFVVVIITIVNNNKSTTPFSFDGSNNDQTGTTERVPDISDKTPCDLTFSYNYNIKVEGPVKIRFVGISDWIYWDGVSSPNFPDKRESTVMEIRSTNPDKPNIWVKIWKK